MAKKAKKTRKVSSGATGAAATHRAKTGRAPRGREWDPTLPEAQAPAYLPEVNVPRPYTSRYPISNETFEALKSAAPKAKLPKVTAELARDKGKKSELSSLPPAAAALAPGSEPVAAPAASANFAGIAATGWLPPDCTMAVGPQHVLASVNSSVAFYSKAGGAALMQKTLTQWFANVVQGLTIFDPKALYDQHAGRWVLLAVAVQNAAPKKSLYLLSISNTSNPLGRWRNYALNAMVDGTTATNNWADFPALGVDNQALYVTSNQFAFGGTFQYAKIRVIPKAGPYSGGAAPFFDFVNMKNQNGSTAFTVQPCHTFGAPQVEYLVNSAFPSGNFLTLWQITNLTAATPTLTRKQVTVSPYTLAPNADQSGGAPPLNTGDVRVLHAVFRGDSGMDGFYHRAQLGCGREPRVGTVVSNPCGRPGRGPARHLWRERVPLLFPACCPDNNGNLTDGVRPLRDRRVRFDLVYGTPRDRPARHAAAERHAQGWCRALCRAGWQRAQSLGGLQRRRRGPGEPAFDLVLQRVRQRR